MIDNEWQSQLAEASIIPSKDIITTSKIEKKKIMKHSIAFSNESMSPCWSPNTDTRAQHTMYDYTP